MTVPRSTGQIPIYYGRKPLGKMRDYREYQPYKDLADTPLYPFGFGLSYTRFTYSDLQLSHESLELGASLRVTMTVTNDGAVAGDEVVQCYIRQYVASTTRPQRELKGFQRISLQPGNWARSASRWECASWHFTANIAAMRRSRRVSAYLSVATQRRHIRRILRCLKIFTLFENREAPF